LEFFGAKAARKVLMKLTTAQYWKTDGSFVASITPFDVTKTLTIKSYKYMFERLREKAGFLDETICRITDQLV